MSLTFKLGSLVIRTLAKPLGNYIKRQAREHDVVRKYSVGFAQWLHRIDMRMRLGLLQNTEAIERQMAKEAAEAEKRKKLAEIPTVKTEAQMKADELAQKTETHKQPSKPRIRPLSEAKAIEAGANFLSEVFIFGVGAGLLLLDSWRSRRKENARREDVAERIGVLEADNTAMSKTVTALEEEIQRLRAELGDSERRPGKTSRKRPELVQEHNKPPHTHETPPSEAPNENTPKLSSSKAEGSTR